MFPPFKKPSNKNSRNSFVSHRTNKPGEYGVIDSETAEYGDLELGKIRLEFPVSSIIKMAQTNNDINNTDQFKSVFNQLRMPDAIKDLPFFDGNRRTLFDFIDNVEEILGIITNIDGTVYSKIILRGIRNKIIGEANEVLNMYGTSLVWENIKNNLILHYSDKRNETSLIRDLHQISQSNDSIEKFYSRIIEIYSTIINHIKIHETDNNVVKSKQSLYSEMCLNAFLSGMKEPLGSIIRAMRPNSLSEAFNYCLQEQNISYVKSTNNYNHKPNMTVNRKLIPHRPNFNPHFIPNIYPNFSRNPSFKQNLNRNFKQNLNPNFIQNSNPN